MSLPNYIVYYVDNPKKSSEFYAKLFEGEQNYTSDNYACVQLKNGLKLGFWSKNDVIPAPDGKPGSSELFVTVDDKESVERLFNLWKQHQIDILQAPSNMGFGYTFLGRCPAGNRLRVGYIFN